MRAVPSGECRCVGNIGATRSGRDYDALSSFTLSLQSESE